MSDFYPESILRTLSGGEMTIKGQFTWSSNYTFLVTVRQPVEGAEILAVYKPTRGERPLWDFPPESLAHREAAAYLVSEALGWHLVPPTVYRMDAPLGAGSLQIFVEHDPEQHYFTFSDEEKQALRRVVLFDLVINNADRKGGHLLRGADGRIWLIDHGISFHTEEKYRSVIWDFSGKRIPAAEKKEMADFAGRLALADGPAAALGEHLQREELDALLQRARAWSRSARFPHPPKDRRAFPYPPV